MVSLGRDPTLASDMPPGRKSHVSRIHFVPLRIRYPRAVKDFRAHWRSQSAFKPLR